MRRAKKAFTLIELLVVVAIIALLISILLPSLAGAREQAKRVKCGVQLRAIGTGMAAYMTDNNEWIAGANTTGMNLRLQLDQAADPLQVLEDGRNPVQVWDFMSPILGYDTELGSNRAERWRTAIDYYACPSNVGYRIDTAFGLDGEIDRNKIMQEMNRAPYRPISYLMPAAFQYFGGPTSRPIFAAPGIRYLQTPSFFESRHSDYRPQMSRVGMPARKIMAADGTRYLDETRLLDFDFRANPASGLEYFQSFGSSGGWWSGSVAYGVRAGSENWDGQVVSTGSPSQGENLPLTYRHTTTRSAVPTEVKSNKGTINGLFFDGHVAAMNDRESRNVEYWYPKGQRIREPGEGLTNVPQGFRVP